MILEAPDPERPVDLPFDHPAGLDMGHLNLSVREDGLIILEFVAMRMGLTFKPEEAELVGNALLRAAVKARALGAL